MAGNIKGIVIEIEGKSSGLVKELDKVNKNLRETEGQLKTVDKALKLDPGNLELIATKQRLVQTAIEQTTQKLELERQAANDAGQALADGTITSNEYNTLQAAIADTTGKLAGFTNSAEESNGTLSQLGLKVLDVAGAIGTVLKDATLTATNAMIEGFGAAMGALADLTAASIQGYGSIEQLEGGMEKLYGTDAQQMINQANDAFLTAGMSAEQYMETATSFSASLINGLGGDTAEAARIADIAIRAMSDNANTFGTDITSIQNAYKNFARGNFSMLDSLSLGFSGTKSGMVDLINASGILEEEITDLDGISFDQMVLAIDAVQQNMNIAGTTASEALGTIEGSVNATQVAWDNLVTGLADPNADIGQLVSNMSTAAQAAVRNIVPAVNQALASISRAIPLFVDALKDLPSLFNEFAPDFLASVIDIAEAIAEYMPEALTTILSVITDNIDMIVDTTIQLVEILIQTMIDNLPAIIEAASQIIVAIVTGLAEHADELIPMMVELIVVMTTELLNHLDEFIEAAIQLFIGIVTGIFQALPEILSAIGSMIGQMLSALTDPEALAQMLSAGAQLLSSFVDGLMSQLPIISDIWNGIKSMFGVETAYASGLYDSSLDAGRKDMVVRGLQEGKSSDLIGYDVQMYDAWAGEIRNNGSMEQADAAWTREQNKIIRDLNHQNPQQVNRMNQASGARVSSGQAAQAALYSQTTVNIGGSTVANVVNSSNNSSNYRSGGR